MKAKFRELTTVSVALAPLLFVSCAQTRHMPAANLAQTVPQKTSATVDVTLPQKQLHTLEEIIASRNDNNPRLDTDFNALSPETKRLFRKKYYQLAQERHNERGTIVYILGKNLTDPEDWAFFKAIVSEPPCLSMENCSTAPSPTEDEHSLLGVNVSLAYPQLMALVQIRNAANIARQAGNPLPQEMLDIIAAAKNSKAKIVSDKAARMEKSPPFSAIPPNH